MKDDSLRLLRCIRFACRFAFEISPVILHVAREPEIAVGSRPSRHTCGAAPDVVQHLFATKPDAERKASEVKKMLHTVQPARAMRLLCDFNVAPSVFPFAVDTPPGLPHPFAKTVARF
jgi:tRNA nucleotidyltransferase/poly(A) polymerase